MIVSPPWARGTWGGDDPNILIQSEAGKTASDAVHLNWVFSVINDSSLCTPLTV